MNKKILLNAVMAAVMLAPSAAVAASPKGDDCDAIVTRRRADLKGVDFSAFDKNLTPEQREYLTFLYAYMPLPDIADHSSDFFLENVDVALQARREMPWGKDIPEREFRHFVVPLRINDEPLDGHRRQFYDELKDRVKNLSIEEAILEINHWCHEKATYQPSDGRTHSPLQTVHTAIGRCGEESTFTVATLRTMGIPARQVYTPRWAHTDDNHAWVEAYANGKWHFLGACEPEPVLDLGWFNAPASRGVLMNTRVLGQYRGPEEILIELPAYTDINVTSNYAPTSTVSVVVTDADGQPADSAQVDFCLYNYGEFYPLTSRTFRAADNRPATFEAGRGDLLVWASDGKNYGFRRYTSGTDGVVTVKMDRNSSSSAAEYDITLVPPKGGNNLPPVTAEQSRINDSRKALEDSIRGAYTATFLTMESAPAVAAQFPELDSERLVKVLVDSRANHGDVVELLRSTAPADRQRALRLLEVISEKDRGDFILPILADNLNAEIVDTPLYDEYILNPRVDNEQLSAFRTAFRTAFSADRIKAFNADPSSWEKWVLDNVELLPDWYPVRVRELPESVLGTRKANARSREIFFVAGARSFGIPARIDPISGKTQWADNSGGWHDALLRSSADGTTASACRGKLKLDYTPVGRIDDPKYYAQFTISKIVDGRPQLMGYDDFAPWSTTFAEPQELDCGQYMLVTGQRMADGSVMSRVKFFNIESDKTTPVMMTLRQDSTGVQVLGSFNAENLYVAPETTDPRSILSTTGRGYYILGILNPTHEPSVHAINDIAALSAELEQAGRPLMLLTPDAEMLSRLQTALASKKMPSTVRTGHDVGGAIRNELVENLKLSPDMLPIFVIADTFNRVVFVTQGYTIGLGDQLLDILHKIE